MRASRQQIKIRQKCMSLARAVYNFIIANNNNNNTHLFRDILHRNKHKCIYTHTYIIYFNCHNIYLIEFYYFIFSSARVHAGLM